MLLKVFDIVVNNRISSAPRLRIDDNVSLVFLLMDIFVVVRPLAFLITSSRLSIVGRDKTFRGWTH